MILIWHSRAMTNQTSQAEFLASLTQGAEVTLERQNRWTDIVIGRVERLTTAQVIVNFGRWTARFRRRDGRQIGSRGQLRAVTQADRDRIEYRRLHAWLAQLVQDMEAGTHKIELARLQAMRSAFEASPTPYGTVITALEIASRQLRDAGLRAASAPTMAGMCFDVADNLDGLRKCVQAQDFHETKQQEISVCTSP